MRLVRPQNLRSGFWVNSRTPSARFDLDATSRLRAAAQSAWCAPHRRVDVGGRGVRSGDFVAEIWSHHSLSKLALPRPARFASGRNGGPPALPFISPPALPLYTTYIQQHKPSTPHYRKIIYTIHSFSNTLMHITLIPLTSAFYTKLNTIPIIPKITTPPNNFKITNI